LGAGKLLACGAFLPSLFGAGGEFSWQVVGTYGATSIVTVKPLYTVVGYRALAVDYSENGRFGKDGLDIVQHGQVMGVTITWQSSPLSMSVLEESS
jgi:hypothetical protein